MRLLISSRNTLVPTGLQQLLINSRHSVVTHYYQDSNQLIAKSILERSELVIMDKSDAEIFTLTNIQSIQNKLPRLKIILLSTLDFTEFMHQCYTEKVDGYITYDCTAEEIEEAIDRVEGNQQFFCQKILTLLLPKLTASSPSAAIKLLTDREMEVAQLIADGKTNKQIGHQLCISPHTVHTHRKSLMKKLGISSAREVTLFILSQ